MLTERTKNRLRIDRQMTTITMRIPVDIVDSLKLIAPNKGFTGYQTLLKSYISEGLRRDEAEFSATRAERLIEALRRRGIPAKVLDEAARDLDAV